MSSASSLSFIDSHCHLSFPELKGDLAGLRQRMAAAQVHEALVISTTQRDYPDVLEIAQQFPGTDGMPAMWASVGVHPDTEDEAEPELIWLLAEAEKARVVAIGETGLDYYRLGARTVADMAWQRERFVTHIEASRQTKLPLIIHTRSASQDTLDILRAEALGRCTGVFHCFTETAEVARASLDMGFDISFSGILTFKNAQALRDVAAFVPLDRCLIETDSPYLAPAPHRGKVNTPVFVPLVAAELARVKNVSLETVAEATNANFRRLFSKTIGAATS